MLYIEDILHLYDIYIAIDHTHMRDICIVMHLTYIHELISLLCEI